MYLSSKPSPFENGGGYAVSAPPPRAGLRIAPAAGEPTGVFVVIEMAILVLVTVLAMVSIIVAGSEDGRVDHDGRSSPQVRPTAHTAVR